MVLSPSITVMASVSAVVYIAAESILHPGLTSISKSKLMSKELVVVTISSVRASQNCYRLTQRRYKRLQPLTSIRASKETPEKFLLPKKEIPLVV